MTVLLMVEKANPVIPLFFVCVAIASEMIFFCLCFGAFGIDDGESTHVKSMKHVFMYLSYIQLALMTKCEWV